MTTPQSRRTPGVAPSAGEAPSTVGDWAHIVGPTGLPDTTPLFVLHMPAGLELLNANHRPHWSERGRITKDLRWTAFVIAKRAKIPPLPRARVWCVYEPPPSSAVKDVANLAPSAKACVDGALVDARILIDDSDEYLVGPDMRRGCVYPQGRLVLLIAELPPTQEPAS